MKTFIGLLAILTVFGITVAVGGCTNTAPTDSSTAPTDSSTAPTDSSTAPTDSSTAPTDSSTAPTDSSTAPTDSSTAPTRQVDLITAVKQGLVVARATGNGIQSMDLSLSSKTSDVLDVTVPAGTIFGANAADVQSMVATSGTDILLNPGDSNTPLTVNVACTNMHLNAPTSSDTFYFRVSKSRDLLALLNLADFQQADPRVQQFAIWTITDNPARDAFVGLETSNGPSGPPTDDEINQIRQLFTKAGITTSKYAALQ